MMKLSCLVALLLCAYAHAAVFQDETVGSITADLGPQTLHLKASSAQSEATEEDKLLSSELVELERNQRNLVADAIKNLLEGFRDVVINGNDDLPPLDPLYIPVIGPFQYSAVGVRASIGVSNFKLDGLRWYVVEDVTVDVIRLALGLRVMVPQLTFTVTRDICTGHVDPLHIPISISGVLGSYHAQGVIGLLSHVAGGHYRVFINRLEVSLDTRVGTSLFGGHLFLRQLDVDIKISDVNIRIDGMVGSNVLNNLINTWVQSAAQNLLKEELEVVSQRISEELFDIIDEVLRDFTLGDLLG